MAAARRISNIESRPLDGELVVHDTRSDAWHALDAATAAVYEALDGSTDAPELAARTGLTVSDVDAALVLLADADLLEETPGISRRSLVKRGAVLGGVAAAGILSMQAPAVAVGSSGTGTGGGGTPNPGILGDFFVPAGSKITLTAKIGTFNAQHQLDYGYRVNGGANVHVAYGGGPYGQTSATTVLGPTPNDFYLETYIIDNSRPGGTSADDYTFYSSDTTHHSYVTDNHDGTYVVYTRDGYIGDKNHGMSGTDVYPHFDNLEVNVVVS